MNNNKLLIISHAFNMDGRAASQTVTDKIPYLLQAGFDVSVISATTGTRDTRFPHRQLLPWGPSALRFDFRHYLQQRLGKKGWIYQLLSGVLLIILSPFLLLEKIILGCTNQWSWSLPAALHASWQVYRQKIHCIYSSGGAWSAHAAAWFTQKITGVQWIAEIHDPLGTASYSNMRDLPFQRWIEKIICKNADKAWWFTDTALINAKKRHPYLQDRGFSVLAGVQAFATEKKYTAEQFLNIHHFGSLSDTRSMTPFLQGLLLFLEKNPAATSLMRIHLYGNDLNPSAKKYWQTQAISIPIIFHGRLTRSAVCEKMETADILLLLHGDTEDCAEYIPSKLFEYFNTTRPVFAVTHSNPQLDQLIVERGGYVCHTLALQSIAESLRKLWDDWSADPSALNAIKKPVTIENTVQAILKQCKLRPCVSK